MKTQYMRVKTVSNVDGTIGFLLEINHLKEIACRDYLDATIKIVEVLQNMEIQSKARE